MNWRTISRNIGYALLVSALFMLLSVGVSILNGNDSALAALIISFTITFICGIFPFIFVKRTSNISLKEGYVIITLSWILSFIFGMLPYALWGGPIDLDTAWFESVSGFTTTGATAIANVELLPKSLLFWRASTHFIGGLGVVVFLLLIIPSSSPIKLRLTNMELSTLSRDAYSSGTNNTVMIFARVYLTIVVVAFISYWAAGMSAFDAICHAMSVSATGGFSNKCNSIAAYDSRLIEGLTMVFMFVSSIHFGIIFISFVRRSLKPLVTPVVKFYSFSVLTVALIVSIFFIYDGTCDTVFDSLWTGLFQTISISSTTGFALVDNGSWPLSINMALVFMSLMCGCAGSTSGGIKADRIFLLFKSAAVHIDKTLHPNSVNEVRVGNHIIRDDELLPHLLYIGLYGFLLAVSILLSSYLGVDGNNSFFASVSCLSNVGPAVGSLGTMGTFADIPAAAKFVYTLDMYFGRLEIYPVLAVLAMLFDGHKR